MTVLTPSAAASAASAAKLFELSVVEPLEVRIIVSTWVTLLVIVLACLLIVWKLGQHWRYFRKFEVHEAEIGIGSGKLKLSLNEVDRQIAYKIWVELSTRKIGLPIDLDHDVVAEVYDSWYTFFTVTRELIKDIPVNKFRRSDTKEVVGLSIRVLNDGLRPHLTTWQARFRRWYEKALTETDMGTHSPQEIQIKFPRYEELKTDMLIVNSRLVAYRKLMYGLVMEK